VHNDVNRSKTMPRTRVRDDERGLALIFLALFLTILMIMAAIVVDIGNARQQRASAQSAVDGAALSAAQVLDTTKAVQPTNVFDLAANATYKSLFMSTIGATGLCAATAPAVCEDYSQISNGVTYDVQVTTPFKGPGAVAPDTSMLNVKACWSVPTVFGRVIGQNSIPICATATAQNGVGTGGPGSSGCGTNNELTQIQNTFASPQPNQTISAVFDTTASANPFPLDTSQIHFVVQTQYGNFVQIPAGPGGSGVPGQSYTMTPSTGGTKVTLSYTLPNTIDTNTSGAYSNMFSANLQVIDTAGRHCGNASWSTCGAGGHDPLFDGSVLHDVGNPKDSSPSEGWGTNPKVAGVTDDGDPVSTLLNSAADADDTVWPVQGTLVSAGRRIGAIYNDENPLRAASVSMVLDGTTVAYGGSGWASNTYTFVDPATVSTALPSLPTAIAGMPAFGAVDKTVTTAAYKNSGIRVTLMDTMGNPMPGETVNLSGTNVTSGLDGRAQFSMPADGTYTVTYSGTRGNGNFPITTSGGGTSVSKAGTVGATAWPSAYPNTMGFNQSSLPLGGSVGIMYNSTGLTDGWHSAVLFANDGDVNNQGGDCGIVAWAFSSTGGSSGPGTLHLVS
jgi:Flp pilus assembly protein TadG